MKMMMIMMIVVVVFGQREDKRNFKNLRGDAHWMNEVGLVLIKFM
jgi:hypothetical protein